MSDNNAIMSDMATNRITVRLPEKLTVRLRAHSRASGTSESNLVRKALERYLETPAASLSAYEWAEEAGVIGSVDGPTDLSTNPRYFEGLGKK